MTSSARTRPAWLIYGARSFALTLAELLRDLDREVLGMIDDSGSAPVDHGLWSGTLDEASIRFDAERPSVALGIGYSDLPARWQAWLRLRRLGWPTPALVHPTAYVARTAQVAEGAVVMAGAIIDCRARIGYASVLWPGACINHDTAIGDNTFVSPNATVCGHVDVGAHCFVGAGAVLADGCRIPEGTFIKMGTRYSEKRQ